MGMERWEGGALLIIIDLTASPIPTWGEGGSWQSVVVGVVAVRFCWGSGVGIQAPAQCVLEGSMVQQLDPAQAVTLLHDTQVTAL
jgi:hypothetical protein